MMIYDRDLLSARRWAIAVGLGNLAVTVFQLYEHDWTCAVAAALWTVCCAIWLELIKAHQKTRDIGRLIEAGVNGMRREIERPYDID